MAEIDVLDPQAFQPCRSRIAFWQNLTVPQTTQTTTVSRPRTNNTQTVRRHPPVHTPAFISSRGPTVHRIQRPDTVINHIAPVPEPEWDRVEGSVKELRSFFTNFTSNTPVKFVRTRHNCQPRPIRIQGLSKEFSSTLFIDECEICFERDREGIRLFNCKHEANCCMECIRTYTNQQIGSRKEPQCPTCTTEFNLVDICVMQVLGELRKNYLQLYRRTRQEKAMVGRSDFFWCPTPNCNNPLLRERISDNDREITCQSCHVTFCFEHRVPANDHVCEQWRQTIEWVDTNTKRCPNCDTPIEKNGGCPHMTCTCGHEFYWCCLSNHKTIQGRTNHERYCNNNWGNVY